MTMTLVHTAELIGPSMHWELNYGVQMGIRQTPVRFNKPPALYN